VEELKMLTQADLERERYEARRKGELDYLSDMRAARQEGEIIGAIHLCEQLLQRPLTPTEQLRASGAEKKCRCVPIAESGERTAA
jgi:hypothetical protein